MRPLRWNELASNSASDKRSVALAIPSELLASEQGTRRTRTNFKRRHLKARDTGSSLAPRRSLLQGRTADKRAAEQRPSRCSRYPTGSSSGSVQGGSRCRWRGRAYRFTGSKCPKRWSRGFAQNRAVPISGVTPRVRVAGAAIENNRVCMLQERAEIMAQAIARSPRQLRVLRGTPRERGAEGWRGGRLRTFRHLKPAPPAGG